MILPGRPVAVAEPMDLTGFGQSTNDTLSEVEKKRNEEEIWKNCEKCGGDQDDDVEEGGGIL